ncbi:hypothetical protein [uncultured Oscillibacter sp.]|uniref:hypothetical protein n=1 Tax=uncultured Oscillibacter sp. TaxID=876091 RepID=UPI00280A99D6|nr:hypothetical protein [uncultured Oscillibacter sp.]
MQIYLAVTPGEYQSAAKYSRLFAHVAYRIGPESQLLRQSLLLQTHGGLLTLGDRDAPPISAPEALCAGILRECARRSYTGVLLDFEARPAADRKVFAAMLAQQLRKTRRTLYVPESCAVSGAVPLICTALSGGSFPQLLQEAARQFGGAEHLGLDVQRLRMDFTLPAKSGEGRPLSADEFRALVEKESPAVFFSQELCARYFTYMQDQETHFVLFDDESTLRQKLKTGEAMGFSTAFFMWPEIRDIAPKLGRL